MVVASIYAFINGVLMAPYLVTIFVVAGAVRKARPPAAENKPYVKE